MATHVPSKAEAATARCAGELESRWTNLAWPADGTRALEHLLEAGSGTEAEFPAVKYAMTNQPTRLKMTVALAKDKIDVAD